MTTAHRTAVLQEYYTLRKAGQAPYLAMQEIRNSAANTIAWHAANVRPVPYVFLSQWEIATQYLNSMTTRSNYWWRDHQSATARPGRSFLPWRNRSHRQVRRKIPA